MWFGSLLFIRTSLLLPPARQGCQPQCLQARAFECLSMVRFGRRQYKSANASKRVRPVTVKRVSYGNGGRVHYERVLLRDEQPILNCSSEIASSVSVRPWAHPPITRSAASSERQVAGEASAFGHYKDWSCSLNTITWRGGLNGYASSASVCDAQFFDRPALEQFQKLRSPAQPGSQETASPHDIMYFDKGK